MIRLLLAAVVLFTGLAFADDKKEPRKLDGTWVVEKAELNGEEAAKVFKSLVLTIEGEKYTVEFGGMTDKGTLKLDTKKDPAEMDITSTEGPNKGTTIPCLFKWDGDNLVVVYGLDAKTRPADFSTKKDSNQMLATYKPKKK
jgi:uncharacterized protein (TIGR03067 family)